MLSAGNAYRRKYLLSLASVITLFLFDGMGEKWFILESEKSYLYWKKRWEDKT